MTNVNPAEHRGPGDRDASQGFTAFDGAVAVVTGGSSGIGLAIGKALCNLGCQVVLYSRDAQKLQRAADEIGAWGLPVDVAERSDMQKLAETVLERFGKVNILRNNAGVGPAASFVDLEVSDWRWMLDVNLWGVIHGLEAFLPAILTAPGGGAIVNTSGQAYLARSRGSLLTAPPRLQCCRSLKVSGWNLPRPMPRCRLHLYSQVRCIPK